MAADRAGLRALLAAATGLPWRAGDLREAPVHQGIGDDGEDECTWCSEGEPVWTGERDGRLTHRHAIGADHVVYGPDGGEPVAGNYDWEEGGIVREQDTRLIVAAVNALPELLDDLDAAERERDQALALADVHRQERDAEATARFAIRDQLATALAVLRRIELDEPATDAERAAVARLGSLAAGQLADQQIIAAAARHNLGGQQ